MAQGRECLKRIYFQVVLMRGYYGTSYKFLENMGIFLVPKQMLQVFILAIEFTFLVGGHFVFQGIANRYAFMNQILAKLGYFRFKAHLLDGL